ncbi:MAG: hypothetical protein R3E01_23400 [Pirellulaceae bacterium]|nr:hypothetical protein [Planctomycetales bacterium]
MPKRDRFLLAILLTIIGTTIGCGRGPNVVPVSGRITMDGQPLADAAITTQPMAGENSNSPGPGSFGKTDADGHYELELVKPAKKGAIVGTHRVIISPSSASTPPVVTQEAADSYSDDPNANRLPAVRRWPASLNDGSLTLEVPPGGRDDADFNLAPR